MWISIIIISIIGTLSHFLYDISNHNKVVGLFTAVNESTWEHIKIAITPTLLWSLYDGYIYGNNPNYFLAKLISLLVIVVVIPLIFYSYKIITKKPILFIDISTFYIAIILSQLAFTYILKLSGILYIHQYLSCIGLFVFFGFYMVVTLLPLKNFIFKDPISSKYGIKGHTETFSFKLKKK